MYKFNSLQQNFVKQMLEDSERQLKEILNQANHFFNKWHLKFYPTKSGVIAFYSKQTNKTQYQFRIGSNIIKIDSQYKFWESI